MGVSTRTGARTSPPTGTTTNTSNVALTSPSQPSNRSTKAASPKAVYKEIREIFHQLKQTLNDREGAHGQVLEFYDGAIARLYSRLLELYDAFLANHNPRAHVDTPRPTIHHQSLENLDEEIVSLFDVLDSHKYATAKHKKNNAGTKVLGDEVLSAQHRLRDLIRERILLGMQQEERRAHAAAGGSSQGLFASSAHASFAVPSTTGFPATGTRDGTFARHGIMAPPPVQQPTSLFSPTTAQVAATSFGPTYSSTFGSQGSFATQFPQGCGGTNLTFEDLAMRGKRSLSRGVEATRTASFAPQGLFSPGSTTTASASSRTFMPDGPSLTFREPTSSFSFGKAARPSTGSSASFTFGGAAAASSTRDAFQNTTPMGIASNNLPSSMRLNGSAHTDQAVRSVASSMSCFSLSSPAPRRESFSFVPTPKSSSSSRSIKRANRSVARNN